MQALQLPAKRGLIWIVDGYRLFAKSPLLLLLLIFGYTFIMMASNIVPIVGPLIATILIPTFSVGLMVACRDLENGRAVEFSQLFAGFRSNFPALLRLGVTYLISTVVILAISALVDGGTLMRMVLFGTPPPEGLAEENDLLWAIELASILLVPVMMGFWFAPMLSAWHRVPALKSLFFSYFACLRNMRAFAVYGLVTVAMVTAMLVILALFATLLSAYGARLAVIVVMPLFFVVVATMFASFYVSYRDIFRDGSIHPVVPAEPPAEPPAAH
jgi:hypothetical protein